MSQTRGLYWFRHDLRLTDMPALTALNNVASEITFVLSPLSHDYHWLTNENESDALVQTLSTGIAQRDFHDQCIEDLRHQLTLLGHTLITLQSNPVEEIKTLVTQLNITHIGCAEYAGANERRDLQQLKSALPNVTFFTQQAGLLFDHSDLPFEVNDIPLSFSKFRRVIEKHCKPRLPSPYFSQINNDLGGELEYLIAPPSQQFFGGEYAAKQQVDYYFMQSQLVANYKQTRNGLSGWDYSSKLSAWLATGCLSPRWVYKELVKFEQQYGANESTYWLYFELLWREYFHWLHCAYPNEWFRFTGIQGRQPSTHFNQASFTRWCKGETGYAIVDACMRQLNATGYMSNRGRQLVASCFVHELDLDWRYGAAYFEAKLIDYDVASNYGNWLYLAGVGTDPRGHRKFDLAKQAAQYDADGTFRQQWL